MPRSNRKKLAYRVKVKEDGQFKTHLIPSRNPKKAASKVHGRVLSSSKVSMEELLKIGDFFKLGDRLMKEFDEERRKDETIKRNQEQNGKI